MMKNRNCDLLAKAMLILAIAVVTTAAQAQTFSVLYNFGSKSGDPTTPFTDFVAQGRDGNLYNTAQGGALGDGAMFKVTPGGTLSVPYSFNYMEAEPGSGLTLATDGNFYGTTSGVSRIGGTVFRATPSGTVTFLYFFPDNTFTPFAPPIQGTDGNFYGTTQGGGTYNQGAVYQITPSGGFAILHSFDNTHGGIGFAPLVQGTDGNFYGTAAAGGANGEYGVVYKITASGKFTVLHNFDGTHGATPQSPLVQGSDGNFYGTTTAGGLYSSGVVFKVTPSGKLTVLHNINGTTDGSSPWAGLVQATDGNFYGANVGGGTTSQGTIFRISPTKPYPYKVLYNFDGTTGASPYGTLLQRTSGILYGDTEIGGTVGVGVFYSLNAGLKPFVSLVSTSGKVGKTIEILGQGFKGTTGVSFNGTPATFTVVSGTYLTAKVPSGATTGFVTVATPKRKLKSNKQFRVTH